MIGNGPPAALGPFTREMTLDGRRVTVVTDPSLAAFGAAGLARPRLHGWRAVVDTVLALGAGYRLRRPAGDIMQLGGAILVDDTGRVIYRHHARSPGDLADPSDIVHAALALLVERRASGRRV